MERILEPEVMDNLQEAIEYDAMDFSQVNTAFASEAIAFAAPEQSLILDAGTGPGRIPIFICQMRPQCQIVAVDLAQNMLQIASNHVQKANLQNQIRLELVDVKYLPYEDALFDLVISNSLVHHLSDPLLFFREVSRVLKPNGGIFIRDLFRPADQVTLNALVDSICPDFDAEQTKLVRDSLHAALTIDEVNELISQADLKNVKVYQSSDRHWTAQRSWCN